MFLNGILAAICITASEASTAVSDVSDDALIVSGIVLTQEKMYDQAGEVFALLYDRTKEPEFLYREATMALFSENRGARTLKRLERYLEKHPDAVEGWRAAVPLYLAMRRIDLALKAGKRLAALSDAPGDVALAVQPLLYAGKTDEAVTLLEKAYEKEGDEQTLLRLITVMELNDTYRKEAIGLLEMHRRMHRDVGEEVLRKLLSLYVKNNDIDGVISVYKTMYAKHPSKELLRRLMQAYGLKRDYAGAAAFLEKYPDADPELLYSLYRSLKRFDAAAETARRLYARTKDPKWLAEEAIMTYEGATDKTDKAMLQKMATLFDRAIKEGADASLYLNYYGYTLIDHDMDVKRGIALLQRALKQQPSNAYYLDSLAWGYYKLGECRKAYDVMEKVVMQEGLSQPEIAQHWEAIRKCGETSAFGAAQ